ncbi:Flp pilus assembly protein CpaB [Burkholderiaceae bacterium FT117]|uniref:Flp pilus assembly protein CpaB n=1 Tax=Zeimonas sediminis TaxID=2944268 RepID=UPI002342BECD|nr:Flp pilus assembly protein CpaB [Zeimonas sediminis]MCM5572018.1 Flp pilus assembly protein CpaB [Zeimonas sediminis]
MNIDSTGASAPPSPPGPGVAGLLAWPARLLRNRTLVLLLVAAAFGALAVGGARGYIAERLAVERERLNPPRAMVEVVVAKRDLPPGAPVDADTMAVRSMPAEYAPGGSVRPDAFGQLEGMRLAQPMRSGEPLLPVAVEPARDGNFSNRIRQGIRAMTIQVDEVNSVSGMLQPGDRIDLLFTVRPPSVAGGPPGDELTAPLMQDLRVLATGSQVAPSGDPSGIGRPFTSITVEVEPDQAQRLIVAQRSGRLTATLRNPEDRAPVAAQALDVSALLGIRRGPAAVARKPAGPELIVGGQGGPLRAAGSGDPAAAQIGVPPGVPVALAQPVPGQVPAGALLTPARAVQPASEIVGAGRRGDMR